MKEGKATEEQSVNSHSHKNTYYNQEQFRSDPSDQSLDKLKVAGVPENSVQLYLIISEGFKLS